MNPIVIAPLLAWIFPGAGHWFLGRRGKAMLFGGIVLGLFLIGLGLSAGHGVSQTREPQYFFAEAGLLAPALIADVLDRNLEFDRVPETYHLGLLYATIAGLLNIVVAMDAFGIALARKREGTE